MSLVSDINSIKALQQGLVNNKVTRFAYTQNAYTNNDVNGHSDYVADRGNNIPIDNISVLKVNSSVIDKGFRARASSITRMLMNHLFGRISYNLNKVNDLFFSTLTSFASYIGQPNGLASLDSTGRIPYSQLPEDAIEYLGNWNASTNTPTLADGTGTNGDTYVVSVAGTQDLGSGDIVFSVNDRVIYNGTVWQKFGAGDVKTVADIAPNLATGNVDLTQQSDLTKLFNNSFLSALLTPFTGRKFNSSSYEELSLDYSTLAYTGHSVLSVLKQSSTLDVFNLCESVNGDDWEVKAVIQHSNIYKGVLCYISGYCCYIYRLNNNQSYADIFKFEQETGNVLSIQSVALPNPVSTEVKAIAGLFAPPNESTVAPAFIYSSNNGYLTLLVPQELNGELTVNTYTKEIPSTYNNYVVDLICAKESSNHFAVLCGASDDETDYYAFDGNFTVLKSVRLPTMQNPRQDVKLQSISYRPSTAQQEEHLIALGIGSTDNLLYYFNPVTYTSSTINMSHHKLYARGRQIQNRYSTGVNWFFALIESDKAVIYNKQKEEGDSDVVYYIPVLEEDTNVNTQSKYAILLDINGLDKIVSNNHLYVTKLLTDSSLSERLYYSKDLANWYECEAPSIPVGATISILEIIATANGFVVRRELSFLYSDWSTVQEWLGGNS